jgi:hypothetical protein
MSIGANHGVETPPAPENNRNGLKKSPCKSVEQAENHEKSPKWPALVVGQKPYGKCQININPDVRIFKGTADDTCLA